MYEDNIMSLIAAGNISAFEQLYKDTYKKVFVFILSMTKCRHTAEDLMHDTYMRVFEKAGSYQIGTNVSTWIMTIARNITYDYFRRAKKIIPIDESFTENSAEISCDDFINNYDDSINIIENIDLEDAFKKLSIPNAQIVVLYAVCGYKHREIAAILSMPEGTIRRRYKEALRQLAVEMGGVSNE
jgi:RNA polymerase sigma-70 factor (ECF subfamily)